MTVGFDGSRPRQLTWLLRPGPSWSSSYRTGSCHSSSGLAFRSKTGTMDGAPSCPPLLLTHNPAGFSRQWMHRSRVTILSRMSMSLGRPGRRPVSDVLRMHRSSLPGVA